MSTVFAVALFVVSFMLFKVGLGALKDSSNHEEYGVESSSLHKKFSWTLIVMGAIAACSAGLLFAS